MCRECTGHLVLLDRESSARRTKPNQTKPKTQTKPQQTETNNLAQDATQVGHAEVKQSERGETNKGRQIKQNGRSVRVVLVSKVQRSAASLRSAGVPLRTIFAHCTGPAYPGFASVFASLFRRDRDDPTGKGLQLRVCMVRSPIAPNKKAHSFQQCGRVRTLPALYKVYRRHHIKFHPGNA